MKKLLIAFFVCSLSFNAFSQITLIKSNGQKIEGSIITYKSGKVSISEKGKGAIGFKISDIKQIISSAPASVRGMRDAYNRGKYAGVATPKGKAAADKNKNLGWGKRAAFYYGMSLLRKGDAAAAEKVFKNSISCVDGNDPELDDQLVKLGEAFCKLKTRGGAGVETILKSLAKKLKVDAKPFFYNIQGDLLVIQDKKPQAVLAYYKTFMIDTSCGWERGYAKSQIANIYKENNDPRAEKIKKLR